MYIVLLEWQKKPSSWAWERSVWAWQWLGLSTIGCWVLTLVGDDSVPLQADEWAPPQEGVSCCLYTSKLVYIYIYTPSTNLAYSSKNFSFSLSIFLSSYDTTRPKECSLRLRKISKVYSVWCWCVAIFGWVFYPIERWASTCSSFFFVCFISSASSFSLSLSFTSLFFSEAFYFYFVYHRYNHLTQVLYFLWTRYQLSSAA